MNIERIEGKEDPIVDSAARFVVMYRLGKTGAPAAAEMYMKVGTFLVEDSRARTIAVMASDRPQLSKLVIVTYLNLCSLVRR